MACGFILSDDSRAGWLLNVFGENCGTSSSISLTELSNHILKFSISPKKSDYKSEVVNFQRFRT